MKCGRNFTDERQLPLVQTIQKVAIAAVVFIESPCLDSDAVGTRFINEFQCNLRLGEKGDLFRDMSFFRREVSLPHSSGMYILAAMRH